MNLSNSKLISLTIGVIGIVWCLAVFTIANYFEPSLHYAGGLMFGLLAAGLSILYLTVFRQSPGRQAAEVGALSVYFTILYVIAAMVSNSAFILSGHGKFNSLLLLSNAAVNAVYFILILYAEKDARRLMSQLARTEQKLSQTAAISAKLGEMLGVIEDDEIRKQILKLKESVDYSTNITVENVIEIERTMERQLDELMDLLADQGEVSAVKSKIREAEITWRARSGAALSRR